MNVNKYEKYVVSGEILQLVLNLIDIYNLPCIVDTAGSIQRLDHSNKIYGLLGQLYQEMSHEDIKKLRWNKKVLQKKETTNSSTTC